MRKIFLAAGIIIIFVLIISTCFTAQVYAKKEVLWEEDYDNMEEGEETGFTFVGEKEVSLEVQSEIANGGKGKALKISPKEGVVYENNYNLFGVSKDISYPNEDAVITFYYYAKGIGELT